MGQLLLAVALAETIHDTEFGVRVEAPVVDSPSVVEVARGEGEGDRQLHFGWEATFSYAITHRGQVVESLGDVASQP